jgi:hypothetical protein
MFPVPKGLFAVAGWATNPTSRAAARNDVASRLMSIPPEVIVPIAWGSLLLPVVETDGALRASKNLQKAT